MDPIESFVKKEENGDPEIKAEEDLPIKEEAGPSNPGIDDAEKVPAAAPIDPDELLKVRNEAMYFPTAMHRHMS